MPSFRYAVKYFLFISSTRLIRQTLGGIYWESSSLVLHTFSPSAASRIQQLLIYQRGEVTSPAPSAYIRPSRGPLGQSACGCEVSGASGCSWDTKCVGGFSVKATEGNVSIKSGWSHHHPTPSSSSTQWLPMHTHWCTHIVPECNPTKPESFISAVPTRFVHSHTLSLILKLQNLRNVYANSTVSLLK